MNIKFIKKVWSLQSPKPGNYFCLAALNIKTKKWDDYFFKWPIKENDFEKFQEKFPMDQFNIYFCPTPFMNPQRKKSYVIGSRLLWADLDDVKPKDCEFVPQIAWKSSDQRYASLWILDDFYPADIIERRNKAMSYSVGADKGGWDLTQVLRLPGTINHKYSPPQQVRTLWFKKTEYKLAKLPEHIYDNLDPREILKQFKKQIKPSTLTLLTAKRATEGKRSEVIWKINNALAEQGINATVRFNLLKGSVWNKFAGRHDEDTQLMREIEKVESTKVLSLDDDKTSDDIVVRMSDIEEEEVEWLWYPYIPIGKVTLFEGDPGLGKSWFTMALASWISNGSSIYKGIKFDKGRVLIMSAEDGLGDTIRPRLNRLDAKVRNIYAYNRPVCLDEDGFAEVEQQIENIKPSLVIIDPIVAYMGSGIDIFRANETREIMAGLAQIAERNRCAIIAVRHLTKSGKDKSIYRGMGSIDITAAARSALMVGPHPEESNHRCICHIKSNLAPRGQTIEYSLNPFNAKRPFDFEGFNDFTAEDIINASPDKIDNANKEMEQAEDMLKDTLGKQATTQDLLFRDAEAMGITRKALKKAAEKLEVKRIKSKGVMKWSLS